MILYDENYNLLSAKNETILDIFGYSSLEKFLNEVDDIADFFIKKDGYIYKFKKFNWIDYLNYSESDIDRALIKNINDELIEVELKVDELLLKEEINGSKHLYIINLTPLEKRDFVEVEIKNDLADIKDEKDREQKIEKKELKPLDKKPQFNININYEKVLNRLDIQKDLYYELLDEFTKVLSEEMDRLNYYYKKGDNDLLCKKIRRLKHISSNLELKTFNPLLNSLERGIKGKNSNSIERFFNLLKKEVDLLSSYLNNKKDRSNEAKY